MSVLEREKETEMERASDREKERERGIGRERQIDRKRGRERVIERGQIDVLEKQLLKFM